MQELQTINRGITLGKFEGCATGLIVKGEPSYEEWEKCGRQLRHIEKGRMWWIGDWLNYGEKKYGEMYTQAMEETGAAYDSLAAAKWVCSEIEFCRRRQNLTFSHHKEVAGLSEEEQELWLDATEKGEWTRQELREQIKASKQLTAPPLPTGTYNVIYVDPPWPISTSVWDKWEQPVDDKYPLMTMEQIASLPVPSLAHDDTHLFLWTTLTFLPDALRLIEIWQFKYHICLTWDKGRGFTLFGYYRNSELLIHSYRGKMLEEWEGEAFRTSFSESSTVHSRKPEMVYSFLEKRFSAPRIELFARQKRDGWESWGNEV